MYLQIPDRGRPAISMIPAKFEHWFSDIVVARSGYSRVFQIVVVIARNMSERLRLLLLILSAHSLHLFCRWRNSEFCWPEGENMIPNAALASFGQFCDNGILFPCLSLIVNLLLEWSGFARCHLSFVHL
jgi:hypothetical protein